MSKTWSSFGYFLRTLTAQLHVSSRTKLHLEEIFHKYHGISLSFSVLLHFLTLFSTSCRVISVRALLAAR